MRKLVFAILFLCIANICSANHPVLTTEEPEKIDLEKGNSGKEPGHERAIHLMEAYLHPSKYIVEVELYNIGIVTVTITNSCGNTICSTSANTSLPVVLNLAIPSEKDTYLIELISDNCYTSGFFSI